LSTIDVTSGEEIPAVRTDQELSDAIALTVPTSKSDDLYTHVGSTFSGGALSNVPVPEQFLIIVPTRASSSDLATLAPLYIQPSEKILVGLDFMNIVAPGDYLATIDTIIEADGKSITLEAIGTTEKIAKMWVSNCIIAEQYRVSITVTTHFGIQLEGDYFIHSAQ